ncbi:MAG: DNA primase [Pseudomonadales bacterium]|jgi:DNA primase
MAGRIPQSFINDLLARVDIVDVIDARVTLKKAGKDYQALCPFHNEKTPSFTVSPDKQFYHCFGCQESGTVLTFLMEHDRMEFVEAVEALAQIAGVEVPREAGAAPARDNSDLYDLLAMAGRHFRSTLRASAEAIDYLKGRGLTGEVARTFGIGYATDEWHGLAAGMPEAKEHDLLESGLLTRGDKGQCYDRFRGRIMFPIRDTRGRVIGFGGRIMGDASGPKYLNSPETPVFHKGRELYGLYEARKALRRIDRLLVVEGYMDVVALAQSDIANAVASLGTAATDDHFKKLYRYTAEVICCFDGDAAGRKAAWRALENALPVLSDGRRLKFMFLPDGEDPDSLVRARGRDGFLALSDNAVPAIEYLFDQLTIGLDIQNLDDQARLASLAMPHIGRVPEGILKQLMLNRMETLTGFSPEQGARVAKVAGGARRIAAVKLSSLSRRLIAYLFKNPALVRSLDADLLVKLRESAGGDLLVDMVNYIDKNPQAELPELLGRWAGHEFHEELLALADRQLDIDGAAMAAEFADGVASHLGQARRAQRRRLLAEMKEDPSDEKFRRFWTLKRGQNDDPAQ